MKQLTRYSLTLAPVLLILCAGAGHSDPEPYQGARGLKIAASNEGTLFALHTSDIQLKEGKAEKESHRIDALWLKKGRKQPEGKIIADTKIGRHPILQPHVQGGKWWVDFTADASMEERPFFGWDAPKAVWRGAGGMRQLVVLPTQDAIEVSISDEGGFRNGPTLLYGDCHAYGFDLTGRSVILEVNSDVVTLHQEARPAFRKLIIDPAGSSARQKACALTHEGQRSHAAWTVEKIVPRGFETSLVYVVVENGAASSKQVFHVAEGAVS